MWCWCVNTGNLSEVDQFENSQRSTNLRTNALSTYPPGRWYIPSMWGAKYSPGSYLRKMPCVCNESATSNGTTKRFQRHFWWINGWIWVEPEEPKPLIQASTVPLFRLTAVAETLRAARDVALHPLGARRSQCSLDVNVVVKDRRCSYLKDLLRARLGHRNSSWSYKGSSFAYNIHHF